MDWLRLKTTLVSVSVATLLFFSLNACTSTSKLKDASIETPYINVDNHSEIIDDFEITGRLQEDRITACYISVVYLNGYSYTPMEWYNYSIFTAFDTASYRDLIDKKLGEVTLDLKGLTYTGTPPSYSSTYDIGTELYKIKGLKEEYAILVVNDNNVSVFYNTGQYIDSKNMSFNMKLSQIFNLISNAPKISSVEFRSEEDGAWISTFQNKEFIALLNEELPKLQLLTADELEKNIYVPDYLRIPINLVFQDGSQLHMQVYPQSNTAWVFNGYINISGELTSSLINLSKEAPEHPRISDILPFNQPDIKYLYYYNLLNNDEITCENPTWSIGPLYQLFEYYRINEIAFDKNSSLVMQSVFGKTKDDAIAVDFYEAADKSIFIKVDNKYYKPVKGSIKLEVLENLLYNYTELWDKYN